MTKFALAREHHLYFEKQQFIELEGVLPLEQLQQLRSSIDQTLALSKKELWHTSSKTLFEKGRDLWRKSDLVKKIALDKQFAKMASELTGEKFIRLGYDQFLSPESLTVTTRKTLNPKQALLTGSELTLESVSSIKGVLCGLLICLNSSPQEVTTSLFPMTAGNIVYFSFQTKIDFTELFKREGQEFILLVYVGKKSIYIHNEGDPNLHAFKELGYVFGDKLSDQLNPVLYR